MPGLNLHGAEVVKPYSQGQEFRHMQLDTNTRGGCCKAISMYWLINRVTSKDFYSWIRTPKGIASVVNTQATGECHKNYGKAKFPGSVEHSGGDVDGWIEELLSQAGIFKVSADQETAKFLEAAEWILHSTGQLKLIGLRGSIGGHAVAADVRNGVTFFDPNFGEIEFPAPGNFMAWFPRFVHRYDVRDTPTSPVKSFSKVIVRNFGVTRDRR